MQWPREPHVGSCHVLVAAAMNPGPALVAGHSTTASSEDAAWLWRTAAACPAYAGRRIEAKVTAARGACIVAVCSRS
jgi:hypothetical protein